MTVAARIHGATVDEHGATAGEETMTPSAHGCVIGGIDFMALVNIPQKSIRHRAQSKVEESVSRYDAVTLS